MYCFVASQLKVLTFDSYSLPGGWQEQVTYPHHAQNLLLFYQMLRRNGFRQEHIKSFFANEGPASGTKTSVLEGMRKSLVLQWREWDSQKRKLLSVNGVSDVF